jgi:hypothetical protein
MGKDKASSFASFWMTLGLAAVGWAVLLFAAHLLLVR